MILRTRTTADGGHQSLCRAESRAPEVEALEARIQLSASLVFSGTQTLAPGTNLNISNMPSLMNAEMQIAINPTNPLNLIAMAHAKDINVSPNVTYMDTYYSLDGGETWTQKRIDSSVDHDPFNPISRFDPTVTFDSGGRAYLAYGAKYDPSGQYRNSSKLFVTHSDDGGATYSNALLVDYSSSGASTGGGLDKWLITTGPAPGNSSQTNVYVAYTDFSSARKLAWSGNRGQTFSSQPLQPPAVCTFLTPVVGADGTVYIVSQNYSAANSPGTLWLTQSSDLTSWSDARQIVQDAVPMAINGAPYDIPAQPGPFNAQYPGRGILAVPSLAFDASGRMYLAYTQLVSGADTDVAVRYSDDNGATWPGFARVNQDATSNSQFHPWIAVDQHSGAVGVVFRDARNDPNNQKVEVWAAISTNRGDDWTEGRISTSGATSDQSGANPYRHSKGYLEYMGLDMRDGTLQAAWADNREDLADLEVYSASASIAGSNNTLFVNGDDGGLNTDDTISVRRSASNSNYLEVIFGTGANAETQYAGLADSINSILIDGGDGSDVISIGPDLGIPVTIPVSSTISSLTVGSGSSVSIDAPCAIGTFTVNGTAEFTADSAASTVENFDGTSGTVTVQTAASVSIANSSFISTLVIDDNGSMQLQAHGTSPALKILTVNSVTINSGTGSAGRLDLTNNAMIIDYSSSSPIANIESLITTGYNAGAWTGDGISSSSAAAQASATNKTALGYAEASALPSITTTLNGGTADSTSVVIRYTWYGDCDLNGTVDLNDYTYLVTNFNTLRLMGDQNYDGNVDLTDFTLLVSNFNQNTLPVP